MAKKTGPPWPRIANLVPVPDLGEGLCQDGRTWLPADAWLSGVPHVANAARWMCGRCPVLAPCRAWALTLPPRHPGVIGGMTRADRERARRQQVPEPEPGTTVPPWERAGGTP